MKALDEIVRLNALAAKPENAYGPEANREAIAREAGNTSSLTPEAREAVGEERIEQVLHTVTPELLDPDTVRKLRDIRVAAENIIIWVNEVLR